VTETWAPSYASLLAPKTRSVYSILYDHYISAVLGGTPLRDITHDMIGRWQAKRLATGAGPAAVRKALALLGSILQRAAESGRISANPARLVRKTPLPRRSEIRPIPPSAVERMRAAFDPIPPQIRPDIPVIIDPRIVYHYHGIDSTCGRHCRRRPARNWQEGTCRHRRVAVSARRADRKPALCRDLAVLPFWAR
jgi:hypothetical protein